MKTVVDDVRREIREPVQIPAPSVRLNKRCGPRGAIALGLAVAFGVSTLSSSESRAATYYWDNNGTASGFGDAGGTWAVPTVSQWNSGTSGTATPGVSVTTGSGDTLNFGSTSNGLGSGTIAVSSTVSAGTMNFASLTGAITLSGGVISGSGTITNSSSSGQTIYGLDLLGNRSVNALSGDITLGGMITSSAGAYSINAGTVPTAGIVYITGTSNSYTGNTSVVAGTVSTSSIGSQNVNSGLGNNTGVSLGGTISSVGYAGKLIYTGTGETTNKIVSLAGTTASTGVGGILDQSGTGVLKFTTALSVSTASNSTKTLTLQGSTLGTGEFAGTIGNASSSSVITVTKAGTGTWTLSASNSYTGATNISAGTLALSNSATNNPIAGSTKISVGTGAALDVTNVTAVGGFALANGQTLAGTGTVTGSTTVAAGSFITAGAGTSSADAIGKLTTGNQYWKSGGTAVIKVNAAASRTGTDAGTSYDTMAMGTLNLSTLSSGSGRFNISLINSSATPGVAYGSYRIASVTGYTGAAFASGTDLTSLFMLTVDNTLVTSGYSVTEGNIAAGGSDSSAGDLYLNYDGGTSSTPEPTTAALFVLSGTGLLGCRRRRAMSELPWLRQTRACSPAERTVNVNVPPY